MRECVIVKFLKAVKIGSWFNPMSSKIKTMTHPSVVKKVMISLAGRGVIHHEKTEQNPLGQSGIHTMTSDILDIVLNSDNECEATRNLQKYFREGTLNKQ